MRVMTGSVTLISESPEDPFSVGRAVSVVLDEQGTVVGWSERARELLGFTDEEALGRPAGDLLVDDRDLAVVREAVELCVRHGGWFGVLPVRDREGRRLGLGVRARRVIRAGRGDEWLLVAAPADEVTRWEIDRSVLEGLFHTSPIGLAVHDPALAILGINRAIANLGGITGEQARGHRIGDFLVRADAETIEARLREVLETGRPMIYTEQSCRLRIDPGRERYVAVSAFRMEDGAGRTLGVTQLVEDVTDRHRARRRLGMLNEASELIGTTLDVETTAQELVNVAVPGIADCVTVDLLQAVGLGEVLLPRIGPLRRAAFKSVAPYPERVMYAIGTLRTFPPDTPQARCLATRRPVLVARFDPDDPTVGLDPERTEHARTLGVHSLMVVPLTARGLVLGLVCLWRSSPPSRSRRTISRWRTSSPRVRRSRSTTPAATPRSTVPRWRCNAACCRASSPPIRRSSSPTAICRPAAPPGSAATGSTSSHSPGPGSRSSSATWWGAASTRRRPWAGCVPPYTHSPTSTSNPTRSSPVSTTS